MPGRYTDKKRKEVLETLLKTGSLSETAKTTNVKVATISRWKAQELATKKNSLQKAATPREAWYVSRLKEQTKELDYYKTMYGVFYSFYKQARTKGESAWEDVKRF